MKTKIICLKLLLLVLFFSFSSVQAKGMRGFRFELRHSDFVKENWVVAYFKEVNLDNNNVAYIRTADPESEIVERCNPNFMPSEDPASLILLQAIPSFSGNKRLMYDDFCEGQFLFDQALHLYENPFDIRSKENRLKFINNAIAFAKKHQISLGKKLTYEQMELLTENIIWLVEEEVKLSGDKTVKALVPYLYAVWPNEGKLIVCELSKFGELSCDYNSMFNWIQTHKLKEKKICQCYKKYDAGKNGEHLTHFWKLTPDDVVKFGSSFRKENGDIFGLTIEVADETTCINKCCHDVNDSIAYSIDDIYGVMTNCPKCN